MIDTETILLKDNLNPTLITEMARHIQAFYPDFDSDAFINTASNGLDELELKARSAAIATALHNYLPQHYPDAVSILMSVLRDGSEMHGWYMMPIAHFVEVYGLDHFDESAYALIEITKRFTSESAIRPYIVRYPEKMLDLLHEWVQDDNEHVRRLVSEGTRPRLPWSSQLPQFIKDPSPILPLLDALKDDESLYVRRSVANNVNDITKDNPDIALDVLEQWSINASENTQWVIKHALRSLIKQGHPRALGLLGYKDANIVLEDLTITPETITMNDSFTLSFVLHNADPTDHKLMVDYIIHFMKANGKTSPKVFKLKSVKLPQDEKISISKRHEIRPITTRKYYPGQHHLEIQVNGQVVGGADFMLDF